jgi:PAS domain S-box-containing protein
LALLIFAFVLIIANGIVALTALEQLRAANRQIRHTLEATQALKQLDDLAAASSRDDRIYRVYGDPSLREAYRASRVPMAEALQRVRDLLAADAQHPEALDRLASLIEQTSRGLAEIQPPVATRGVLPPELRDSIARSDAVVTAIDSLLADQQSVLDKRLAVIASRNTVTFVTVLIGTGGGIALVGIVFVLMRQDLQSSLRLAEMRSGALQQSEQRFRRIFEGSPLGILLGDPDGRISQANPAFCRMLGRTADELVGKTVAELAHLDDRDALTNAIRCGTESDQEIETRYITRTGGIAWASVHLTQLIASDDRARLLLVLSEDITGQRRAEAELRQAQKMEAIGQLTGGIAHDFNNLLGVIIGNVEFLLESASNAMQAEMAKEILDSALSGADLTRRLLAFARRQPLQPRRIDLNAYLPNHIAIVRRLLGEAVTIAIDLSPDLWPTRADPSQVGDALLNLAINARDAMPHGGNILIRTENVHLAGAEASEVKSGDYVVLSMTDTGIGMTPEVRERVMEPFFTTKAPGSGSGLGLSMIFGFAKQSGGHLDIESAPGQGTTVRLYLPRALGQEVSEAEQSDWTMLPQGHESILLVDDKPEMRAVARRHLVSLGYQVSEADCGSVALEMLRAADNFDLLFTDIVMPEGMSGHQLAAAAKHLRPGLKVLFTTGYFHTDPDESPSPDSDTIRKPYRRQELAAAVRAALEA